MATLKRKSAAKRAPVSKALVFDVTLAAKEIVAALAGAAVKQTDAALAMDNATGSIRDWLLRGFAFCHSNGQNFEAVVVEPLLGNTKRDKTANEGLVRSMLKARGTPPNVGSVACTQGRVFARWLVKDAPAAQKACVGEKGAPVPLKALYKAGLDLGLGTGKRRAKAPVTTHEVKTAKQLIAAIGPANVLRELSAMLLESKATKLQAETLAKVADQISK